MDGWKALCIIERESLHSNHFDTVSRLKKVCFILALSCISILPAQSLDEVKQYTRIINFADTLFYQRKYKESLPLYERGLKFCMSLKREYGCGDWLQCEYPYSQIRVIMDGNLIIRNRKKDE